jgi:hypothetical protein
MHLLRHLQFNLLLDTDAQQVAAASRLVLCAGPRRR